MILTKFFSIILLLFFSLTKCVWESEYSKEKTRKETFYSYSGFYDWYRFPLKYPYQIRMIDTLEEGYLEKYSGTETGVYDVSSEASKSVLSNAIVRLHLKDEYALFLLGNGTYGRLLYDTGEIRYFQSLQDLNNFCNTSLSPDNFKSMEYYYSRFEKGEIFYSVNE